MASKLKSKNKYWQTGEPMVWLSGAALSLTLLTAVVLLIVIMINGLGVFWPAELQQLKLKDGSQVAGKFLRSEPTSDNTGLRRQYKIANRDVYGLDFRWIDEADIVDENVPEQMLVLERVEHGDFYGMLKGISSGSEQRQTTALSDLEIEIATVKGKFAELSELEEKLIDASYRMEQIRLKIMRLDYDKVSADDPNRQKLISESESLGNQFGTLVELQSRRTEIVRQATATFVTANGKEKEIVLADIFQVYAPNQMTTGDKIVFYLHKLVELFVGEPRESNTEGGLFPAIFGTVMLIFVMSIFSFPLGVIAAVYLREYAKDGVVVRIVRIAVNNLAGIPSIVYGIFGLGFFIYGIGHGIDSLFFPERLPTPTFGTGGLLWASLTLALLTVPVVIVSTEEALGVIPREMREGSYALGATKFQTLVKILLPMASPGIMTGLILAMARAAGEVAPLMITGVVKLAPALALDGNFPFLHLDRKFMHLGFHIYDIGFQSPNVEAAKPMVFVTTLLLVLIVLIMSSVAIRLRNKMKKRYTFGTF